MPPEATPETVHAAIEYAMAVHLSAHADALRIRVLPLPFLDCATCQAIQGALGVAHELVETSTPPRRTRP